MPKPVVDRDTLFDEETDGATMSFEQLAQSGYGTLANLPSRRSPMIIADGELSANGYHFTKTRLIMPSDMTQEQWAEVGSYLATSDSSIQWWIGDWMNRATKEWGDETIEMAITITGYKPETLYNIASIAAKIHFSLRNENLSFQHHVAVAKLSADLQKHWLKMAETNKWSYRDLRKAIKDNALTDSQRERRAQAVDRKRYVNYFASVAKVATSSKTITDDQYREYEAQLGALLAELGRRVKQS